MSLEASSTPAKSPAFAGKARATAAVHPEKSARHPSARTTARMTCIVVPLALPACNRVLTTSNLATVGRQHGACSMFFAAWRVRSFLGRSWRRQQPPEQMWLTANWPPSSSLRWGRALGHECGSRPRATGCHICIMHRQVGAARLFAMRPHGMMTDQPKLPARPVGRQVGSLRPRALCGGLLTWRLLRNRSGLGCAPSEWGTYGELARALLLPSPGAGTV